MQEIHLNVHERKPLQQTTDIVIKVQGVEASPSFDKKGNDSRRQNDGTTNISFVYKLKYKQTMKVEKSNLKTEFCEEKYNGKMIIMMSHHI